jgi:AraC-like DNA-binding protein
MPTRRPAMFRGSDGSYRDDPTMPLRRARARGDIGLWAWGRAEYPGEPLAPGDFPGLLSAGMWEVEADQNWGLDWHYNEGVEVTFVTRGRVGFGTTQEEHDLQRGWVTVTRPWQRHHLGAPNVTACTLGWFVLDVGALRPNQRWDWPAWLPLREREARRLTDRLRGSERSIWPITTELTHALDRLERTMRGQHAHPVPRVAVGIAEVLLELSDLIDDDERAVDPYYSSSERTVEVFLGSLHARLAEPWTVDSMSAACGLGRTRFIYYCRQTVNAAPLDYLNGLRVDRALDLLKTTQLSVADISYACGFSSSQYFATVFKRQFGRSPSTARGYEAATPAGPKH